jgi:hypothetical protein
MRLFLLVTLIICSVNLFGQPVTTICEGFENWPPANWSSYTLGAGNGWTESWQNAEEAAHTGQHSAYSSINNSPCNNWLVLPAVNISSENYQLIYWEKFDNIEDYESSAVLISTGSADPVEGDFVPLFSNTDPSIMWVKRELDLSAYEGQVVYIAFQNRGTFHTWFVDDVVVGPENFTDAVMLDIVSPSGVSMMPGTELVRVRIINKGLAPIHEAVIDWSVNGLVQQQFVASGFTLLPGVTRLFTLGTYNFFEEGNYLLSSTVNVPDDYNPPNNTLEANYAVSSFKDARMTGVDPESFTPGVGIKEVRVYIENLGVEMIDSAEISWTINGEVQTKHIERNLQLLPGANTSFAIGQYNFSKDVYEISANAYIIGDTNELDNVYKSYAAIDTFWESFEGRLFPPQNWSINFGTKDGVNFDVPPHGLFYYVATPDENIFGKVTDTLYMPQMNIASGDSIHLRIKKNPFLLTTTTLIAKDLQTGNILILDTITTADFAWYDVGLDLSAAQGIHTLAIVNASVNPGETKVDFIRSSAEIYIPSADLAVTSSAIYFLARKDVEEAFSCTIKNLGQGIVSGDDYQLRLMDVNLGEIASADGIDIEPWSESSITVPYTFTEFIRPELYLEIDFPSDNNPDNNRSWMTKVQVVPDDIVLNATGDNPYINLNFPFNSNGSTQSLGEDDLSQTVYTAEELGTGGNLYGIIFKYDNLLNADYQQKIPIKIWANQNEVMDLSGGWYPVENLTLIFDDTISVLPGNDRELYLPFDNTIAITGSSNLLLQFNAYSPEWPPSIVRFYADKKDNSGLVRTISALDVFALDPLNPPVWFSPWQDIPLTTFVIQPVLDTGKIYGHVYDLEMTPVPGATISIDGTTVMASTGPDGAYELPFLPWASYHLSVTAPFYNDEFRAIALSTDSLMVDFALTPKKQVTISGHVGAAHMPEFPLQNVVVNAIGYTTDMSKTDINGDFSVENIFGISTYEVTFSLHGYADTALIISVTDQAIDLGEILMRQEFLGPFDVYAVLQNGKATIEWKDGLESQKQLMQTDFNNCPDSYTNEPNENVWLGNVFKISDTTTITAVEIRTDVYDLGDGDVTIDVYDHNQELLITSLPFAITNDSTIVVDIPNIVVYNDIYAMVHWEGLSESTHALCFDNSDSHITNSAVIKYPNEDIQLVSDYFGTSEANFAFLVRVHTLEPALPETSGEVSLFNLYKGRSEEFPNTASWELLNQDPLEQLWFVDSMWTPEIEAGEYRYVVESSYSEGNSEGTFSNPINWDGITGIIDPLAFKGRIEIFPNPANEKINIEVELEETASMILSIYSASGQLIDQHRTDKQKNVRVSRLVNTLPNGSYVLYVTANGQTTAKTFLVFRE